MSANSDSSSRSSSEPQLLFFHSRSGPSHRAERYLAVILQRHGNHNAFKVHLLDVDEHAETARRFGVRTLPTLVVIDHERVGARLEAPTACGEIEAALARWLA